MALLRAGLRGGASVFTGAHKVLLQYQQTNPENEIALDFSLKLAS